MQALRHTTLRLLLATALALLGAAGEARASGPPVKSGGVAVAKSGGVAVGKSEGVPVAKSEGVPVVKAWSVPVQKPHSPGAVWPPSTPAPPKQKPASTPGGGAAPTGPVESNTTTQVIAQVQVSECLVHCQGVTQSQSAEQQNTTVQVVTPNSDAASGAKVRSDVGKPSKAGSNITQIQIGCLAKCHDSTSSSGPLPSGVLQAVGHLLTQPLGNALQELLTALGIPGLPGLAPLGAAEQNVVSQVSSQLQVGPALGQTQSASQSNATVQVSAEQPGPGAGHGATGAKPPGGPTQSAVTTVANQTGQAILQLQIGCLLFCDQTQQSQQAGQSNTTVQVLPGSGAGDPAAAVNSASQLIYQVQIGCLYSCDGATELQTAASSDNAVVVISGAPRGQAPSPLRGLPAPGLSSGD